MKKFVKNLSSRWSLFWKLFYNIDNINIISFFIFFKKRLFNFIKFDKNI